jgi:hypothetical protein
MSLCALMIAMDLLGSNNTIKMASHLHLKHKQWMKLSYKNGVSPYIHCELYKLKDKNIPRSSIYHNAYQNKNNSNKELWEVYT